MKSYTINMGELDPVEDASLLPKDEQIIIGERRARAVVSTPEKETAFLSSPYDPTDRQLHAEAMVALLVAVSDFIMDSEFQTPENPPKPSLTIVP